MAIFCPESENSMFGKHLDALSSFLTQHNIPPKNEVEVQKGHFSGEKIRKKKIYLYFLCQNLPKLISDIICYSRIYYRVITK